MNLERFSNLIVLNIQKERSDRSFHHWHRKRIYRLDYQPLGKELVLLGKGRPHTRERRKSSLTNLPSATQIESVIFSLFNYMMYSNFNVIHFQFSFHFFQLPFCSISDPWKHFEWIIKQLLIFEGVIRLKPLSSADNTLLDLHNSSYHAQPRPITANYAVLSSRQLKQIVGFLAHL